MAVSHGRPTGQRATSTVLDAALFLLLVGGAVATLGLPGAATDPGPPADHTTNALAASTADVHYSLAPGACEAENQTRFRHGASGPAFRRIAHGTLASHLADAAVGNLSVGGVAVTHSTDDYERQVRNATRNVTRGRDQLTQVRAVWRPYRNAPVEGVLTVGPTPPPDATVRAATLTVDSGMPSTADRAGEAARNGSYENVSRVIAADGVVPGLFPRAPTRQALADDYPVSALVRNRYERVAVLVGGHVSEPLARDDVAAANANLSTALADLLAADMRARFDSPRAAARTVAVDEVRITVRTWSP
jgi:hypothetical protein